jgi:Crp-like helix-turn-helix protein
MHAATEAFSRNRILVGLPAGERHTIEPLVELTSLNLGDTIDRPGEPVHDLHFPIDSAISMMDMKDPAHTLDVALIGPEGCSGAWVVQGSETSPSLNIVEIGGRTVRIPAATMMEHLPRLPYLQAVLSRYNLLMTRHIVISVGCSQFHSSQQRIARWLLSHTHRTGLTVFPFTTEFLAAQAGIDRQTTRQHLEDMERRGIIARDAKSVTIRDLELLVQQSCACIELTKDATDGYVEALTRLSRAYAH